MGLQVGDGSLAGDDGLDEEAKGCKHGKAAVLDLLHLQSQVQPLLSKDWGGVYCLSHSSLYLCRLSAIIQIARSALAWPTFILP